VQICVIRGLVFIRGLLCVFVANHFAAGKYIFGHKKGLFEASIPVLPSRLYFYLPLANIILPVRRKEREVKRKKLIL